MSSIVIVGAGQTGRGFINRFVALAGERATFVDRDAALVERLAQAGAYTVEFSSGTREPIRIDNFEALHVSDPAAAKAVADADIVFVSVGKGNLPDVCGFLAGALSGAGRPVDVVTAENGVRVSAALDPLREIPGVSVAESIVFCTTLAQDGTLDVLSEDQSYLPYDRATLGHDLALAGLEPEMRLDVLMQRKIYTYNCVSACVAYLGAYKGIAVYADAANDGEVALAVDRVLEKLNPCIAETYDVPLAEQVEFSRMAVRKFRDRGIVDTVDRNVRDPERKLARDERIMAPLLLMSERGVLSRELLLVAAAAVHYGERTSSLTRPVSTYFEALPDEWQGIAMRYLGCMTDGEPLRFLLERMGA